MKRNSTRRKWMLWTKESTWTASLWPRQLPVCKAKLKMHSQHLKCHPLRRTEPSSGLRQVCEYFFWSTCLHHSLVETLCSLDASRRSAVQQCVCLGGLSIKHSHQGAPPVCAGSSMQGAACILNKHPPPHWSVYKYTVCRASVDQAAYAGHGEKISSP